MQENESERKKEPEIPRPKRNLFNLILLKGFKCARSVISLKFRIKKLILLIKNSANDYLAVKLLPEFRYLLIMATRVVEISNRY